MYIKWIIISCYLLSLYPAVNFLSLWLSGIIAFINRNGDSAYLWNIPLLIFASASCSQSYSPGFHGFLIKFMTSDILYMLMQFIIQLCRTISHAFLLSIHAIDRFYCFVLLSLRVCWSMLSYSPVPLDPLWHSLCSLGNNPRLVSQSSSEQRQLMVIHWILCDSKSLQVSRTLLSIPADLSNAVVRMVSTLPLIFKSYSPCKNPSVIVPSVPITNGITVTFMSYRFFFPVL